MILRFNRVILVFVAAGLAGTTALLAANPPKAAAGCSSNNPTNHVVTIKNGQVSPDNTVGRLCDQLTIINQDTVGRLVAFGPHDHHTPYDGVTERLLEKGQSLVVTLTQTGSFTFHDHLHDWVIGYFTVTP